MRFKHIATSAIIESYSKQIVYVNHCDTASFFGTAVDIPVQIVPGDTNPHTKALDVNSPDTVSRA